jgi:hypothetical protein
MSKIKPLENLKGDELHPFSCCSSLLIHKFTSCSWSKEELKRGFLHLMNREYQDNLLVGIPHYLNRNRTFFFRIDQYAFVVFYIEENQPIGCLLDEAVKETKTATKNYGYASKTSSGVNIFTFNMSEFLGFLGITDEEIVNSKGYWGFGPRGGDDDN